MTAVQVEPGLTDAEREWITRWKWAYTLEAYGFSRYEARKIGFLKWLYVTWRVEP